MNTPLSRSVKVAGQKATLANNETEVYIPKSFVELGSNGKPTEDPLWVFKAFEIRYLDALHRGEDPQKAIEDARITPIQVTRLLKSRKAKEYMGQRLRERFAAEGWTQDKWFSEIQKVWYGQKLATREMMEAIKEIGARVAPKPEKARDGSERPIININLGLAEAALKRQEIIEASIVDGSESSLRKIPDSL